MAHKMMRKAATGMSVIKRTVNVLEGAVVRAGESKMGFGTIEAEEIGGGVEVGMDMLLK